MCSNLGLLLLGTADANHLNLLVGPQVMLATHLQLKLNEVKKALSYPCTPSTQAHTFLWRG
jgi:hypothetical protein